MSFSWPARDARVFKPDLESFSSDNTKTFQLQLSNRFSVLDEISDPESLFEIISTAISEVAIKTLTTKTSCQPEWMSCNSKKAIDNKHKAREAMGTSSTEYKVAKAESKKLVKKDRLNQVEKDMDTLSSLPSNKQYYTVIKKLKTKARNISWGIKSKMAAFYLTKKTFLNAGHNFTKTMYWDDSASLPLDDSDEDPITQYY